MPSEHVHHINELLRKISAQDDKSEEAFVALNKAIAEKKYAPDLVSGLVKAMRDMPLEMKAALGAYLELESAICSSAPLNITKLKGFASALEAKKKGDVPEWFVKHMESVGLRLKWLETNVDYFNQYEKISAKATSMSGKGKSYEHAASTATTLCANLDSAAKALLIANITGVDELQDQKNVFLTTCMSHVQTAAPVLNKQHGWKAVLADFANWLSKAFGYGDQRLEAEKAGRYSFFRPQTESGVLVDALKDSLTKAKSK
jgi:hypothetical protein